MKRKSIVLFSLLALLMLYGCKQTERNEEETQTKPEQTVGMANPMVEAKSLEEINELSNGNLVDLGIMGKDNQKYYTINTSFEDQKYVIAEYDFDINNYECCFRFVDSGNMDFDISGYYINGGQAFPSNDIRATGGQNVQYNTYENIRLARWITSEGQYTFTLKNIDEPNPIEIERFYSLVDELCTQTSLDAN